MARWILRTAHYLYTHKPTEWEYKEIGTEGETRFRYEVPRYIDAERIVCVPGKGDRSARPPDVELALVHPKGHPIMQITRDMDPLDDEAEALSQEYQKNWKLDPNYLSDVNMPIIRQSDRLVGERSSQGLKPLAPREMDRRF